MDSPIMLPPRNVAGDTHSLTGYFPLPGFGVLPINSFVIHAAEPVLIDTGLAVLGDAFMQALRTVLAPEDLRWIWLTHTDPDHLGSLAAVLQEAPNARVVTTFLGMGKLGLLQYPLDRAYLLNPGQALHVGDRHLHAFAPACFDAPETTGLFDDRTRTLFSSDCFGALLDSPAEDARDVPPEALREGMMAWARIDAPWLGMVDGAAFGTALDRARTLQPEMVLSSHLPPAPAMLDTLLSTLDAARGAPAFVGPDQAALEAAMAGQISAA